MSPDFHHPSLLTSLSDSATVWRFLAISISSPPSSHESVITCVHLFVLGHLRLFSEL